MRVTQLWTFNKSYFTKQPNFEYELHCEIEEAELLVQNGEAFRVVFAHRRGSAGPGTTSRTRQSSSPMRSPSRSSREE